MKVVAFIVVAGFICQASCMSFVGEESILNPEDVICDDCKVLFKDIKYLIQSEESKITATAGVTLFVCGEESDTALRYICKALVDALVSPLLEVIGDEVEPEEACVCLSMCNPEGIYQDLKFDKLLLHHFFKKVEKEIKKDLNKHFHH